MEEPTLKIEQLLTAEFLCEHLGCTRGSLAGWRQKGLPYVMLGNRAYYLEADFVAWAQGFRRVNQRGRSGTATSANDSTVIPHASTVIDDA